MTDLSQVKTGGQAGHVAAGQDRLPYREGEWIDRSQPLDFTFEGTAFTGFAGDTLSSALWANGAHILGRSFKYHRVRGILSMANHDINTMMQDAHDPTIRADATPLTQGRRVRAVNTFGGLKHDKGARLNMLSAFLPAGFYYKTFHTPKWAFPQWEKVFRALTGLGVVNPQSPRVYTPKRYGFADVLVIGAGAAGLSAAVAAAKAGAHVVVVDENARAGGSLTYNRGATDESSAVLRQLLDEAGRLPNLEIRPATVAAGYYADHWVPLVDAGRMTKMRAGAVVVASGAYEQPAVFRNNDLPGIMLTSAAQRLMYRYAVKPVDSAVVLAANTDAYRAALDLVENGVRVPAIIDLRPNGEQSDWRERAVSLGIQVYNGACIYEAVPTRLHDGVQGAVICKLDAAGRPQPGTAVTVACNGILMGVGYAPAANLLYQAGTKMRYDETVHQFVPGQLPEGVFAAGRVNGIYTLPQKLADGQRAGMAAAAHAGFGNGAELPQVRPETVSPSHPYPIYDHPQGKNFVDFDEDLTLRDFYVSVQEGFDNIELMKRFTTVGMGPSQGKHSNMNAVRILARQIRLPIGQVGTTTARPFFHPVKLSHLAGRGFHPERLTPMHEQHRQAGAVFMQAGNWLRPEYYARPGISRAQAIREEVRAVRGNVGMIDVGTLGKIEISGPDAVAFIERLYTFNFAKMKVGMTRYALMCDEAGVVIDDGVVGRLSETSFFVTTTTTGSASVFREMNRWALLWGMEVGIVNATGAWAAMNLAGPNSRKVLEKHVDIDVSAAAVPYLALRECQIGGVPVRIMRVGFVGELGYEIHVPAESGPYVWDLLMQDGKEFGIRPFGVEAQRVLRLEKGHIIVSQDTDGLTDPFEANCGWAVKLDKPFFVGQRSLRIRQKKGPKQVLAGFALPPGYTGPRPLESHLIIEKGDIAGRVTSVTDSDSLGRVIGLAMVRPDLNTVGNQVQIRLTDGSMVTATLVPTPFYDPEGARQKL